MGVVASGFSQSISRQCYYIKQIGKVEQSEFIQLSLSRANDLSQTTCFCKEISPQHWWSFWWSSIEEFFHVGFTDKKKLCLQFLGKLKINNYIRTTLWIAALSHRNIEWKRCGRNRWQRWSNIICQTCVALQLSFHFSAKINRKRSAGDTEIKSIWAASEISTNPFCN